MHEQAVRNGQENGASVLPKRELGKTGLFVTPFCLGTAPLGSMPKEFTYTVSDQEALQILKRFFASPINFLDTASNYGESEKRIGLALKELGGLPKGFVLQTKVDRNMQTGDFSGEQIKCSLEQSLKLLGVDRLQMVYIHDPEYTTFENVMSSNGPLAVLKDYKRQGVIDHIGVAGGPIDMLVKYTQTGEFEAVITHNRNTLLFRVADPLFEAAAKRGVAVLNAAPFGSGLLASGASYGKYAYREANPEMLDRVRKIEKVCKRYRVPLKAAALQFSLRNPLITSTIVGMGKPEYVDEAVSLAKTEVPDELFAEVDQFAIKTGDPESSP